MTYRFRVLLCDMHHSVASRLVHFDDHTGQKSQRHHFHIYPVSRNCSHSVIQSCCKIGNLLSNFDYSAASFSEESDSEETSLPDVLLFEKQAAPETRMSTRVGISSQVKKATPASSNGSKKATELTCPTTKSLAIQRMSLKEFAKQRVSRMDNYSKIEKIGEGTYGVVYKGRDKTTQALVALKKVRINDDQGIPATTLREVCALKELEHKRIVRLIESLTEIGKLYLVFEYIDFDMRKYLDTIPEKEHVPRNVVKSFMYQIFEGINYCHARRVIHRDLKPQNILVSKNGCIKLADFGLARAFAVPMRAVTHEIVTLWYRSPEVLLGTSECSYGLGVDTWSIGCIFAELWTLVPIFEGDSEIDQCFKIFGILSTPDEVVWPGCTSLPNWGSFFPTWTKYTLDQHVEDMAVVDEAAFDLLKRCFFYNPADRIFAIEAMVHEYFEGFDPNNIPALVE